MTPDLLLLCVFTAILTVGLLGVIVGSFFYQAHVDEENT